MKGFTVALFAIALISSCKTSFRISVKEPAIISIPDHALNFGIINSVDDDNSPEKAVGAILNGQQINGNKAAAERSIDGVHRALENSNRLSGLTIQSDSVHNEDGSVNWAFLDSTAAKNKLDGFIEVAEIRTISPIGGSVLANAQGSSSSKLEGTAYVNYYINENHWSQERMAVYSYYNIPTSGTGSVIDILNDIQKKKQYYRELGFSLGLRAGRLIYPNWVWVDRSYYTKGSKELKRAKPMIQKGNWDIAEKQLLYGIDHSGNKARGRTYFNLALVKEGQGYVDKAIEYAETAALEYGDKMANDYLVKLRKRKAQLEQMN
jgi:hypothetical protein